MLRKWEREREYNWRYVRMTMISKIRELHYVQFVVMFV